MESAKLRCKVGDRALIIGGAVPETYGRVVIVVEALHPSLRAYVGDDWRIEAANGAALVLGLHAGTMITVRDRHLLPLCPGADPVDESRDEPVEAAA